METCWCQVLGGPGRSPWTFSIQVVRTWLILRGKAVTRGPWMPAGAEAMLAALRGCCGGLGREEAPEHQQTAKLPWACRWL